MIAIIGCIIGILSFIRSGNKDGIQNAEAQGRMAEKIDELGRKIDKVCNSIEEVKAQNHNLEISSRQSEEKFKTLFTRIQGIEERVLSLEHKA